MKPETDLAGQRVFVVEDESLVMMLLEDSLVDAGCEIAGMASRVDDALEKAAALSYDVAVLDVNLNGRQTFEVARCIAERGIPYVFATGYGPASLLADFRHVPILQKPFQQQDLETALRQALAAQGERNEPTPPGELPATQTCSLA
ncbi:response regulator [Bradyrhizobium symbiodeficiens]|jgi:CheY-like chemotaxis protein|uniref:response regulator n=1 Tax=Bradyrhizobium symbiodeficiens TaxID=1404367 RepID=UPI0030D3A9D6